ncbi:hypothetical protein ABH904_005426 [Pseudomonas frederiksbergensis]
MSDRPRAFYCLSRRLRGQARSHRGLGSTQVLYSQRSMWERACPRRGRHQHRVSPICRNNKARRQVIVCGLFTTCSNAFAGKPAPTGARQYTSFVFAAVNVGAGLPAKRPAPAPGISNLQKQQSPQTSDCLRAFYYLLQRLRGQARSHRGLGSTQVLYSQRSMWERACPRRGHQKH